MTHATAKGTITVRESEEHNTFAFVSPDEITIINELIAAGFFLLSDGRYALRSSEDPWEHTEAQAKIMDFFNERGYAVEWGEME